MLLRLSLAATMALGALLGAGCGSCAGERADRQDAAASSEIPRTGLRTVRLQARAEDRAGAREAWQPPPVPRLVSLRLLDPGKGRQQTLRYRPDATPRAFVITARIRSRELADSVWGPWVDLPALGYGLDVDWRAGGPAGEEGEGSAGLGVRGRQAGVGAPAPRADAAAVARAREAADDVLARYRDNLEGRRATVMVDDRGLLGEVTLAAGTGDAPQPGPHTRQEIQQLLLESVVPFPEEPVGIGARWRVNIVLRRGAAVVSQVAEYTLVEARADRVRIAARIEQNGEHQITPAPELPPGVSAELLALVWRATGELVISPASLTPVSGKLEVEYRVHGRLEHGLERSDHLVESLGTVALSTAARI